MARNDAGPNASPADAPTADGASQPADASGERTIESDVGPLGDAGPEQPGTLPDAATSNREGEGDIIDPGPYMRTADSMSQPGVPKGKITSYTWASKIYGDSRTYKIYVPAQYDKSKPAPLMVFQDGSKFISNYDTPIIFDNLIHKKELPPIIVLFIDPGSKRATEYDSPGDRYVGMLVNEVIPEVNKLYPLVNDPSGWAIGGHSSGGSCAFTAAWERPDKFSRVMSFIGSFYIVKGGNKYPQAIRSSPPKPIRVFLQDGSNDLNGWPEGNKAVAAALKEKDYHYRFVFGDAGHDGRHGNEIFPETLRWLWRGYPIP